MRLLGEIVFVCFGLVSGYGLAHAGTVFFAKEEGREDIRSEDLPVIVGREAAFQEIHRLASRTQELRVRVEGRMSVRWKEGIKEALPDIEQMAVEFAGVLDFQISDSGQSLENWRFDYRVVGTGSLHGIGASGQLTYSHGRFQADGSMEYSDSLGDLPFPAGFNSPCVDATFFEDLPAFFGTSVLSEWIEHYGTLSRLSDATRNGVPCFVFRLHYHELHHGGFTHTDVYISRLTGLPVSIQAWQTDDGNRLELEFFEYDPHPGWLPEHFRIDCSGDESGVLVSALSER